MDISGTCISSTTDEHGPIYVYQTRTSRTLSFDGEVRQSCMKLNNINGLELSYTQGMMTGLLFMPTVNTVTIMGLGAGSMAKNLLSSFPKMDVHAVEYRESVVKIAEKYFYLPDSNRLFIHIDDAVNHIKHTTNKSDIIFSDLYNTAGMVSHQAQASYLRNCKHALNDHGVLVLNICNTSPQIREVLEQLLRDEFDNQLLRFEVKSGNTIILTFKNEMPVVDKKALMTQAKALHKSMNIPMEQYAKLILKAKR